MEVIRCLFAFFLIYNFCCLTSGETSNDAIPTKTFAANNDVPAVPSTEVPKNTNVTKDQANVPNPSPARPNNSNDIKPTPTNYPPEVSNTTEPTKHIDTVITTTTPKPTVVPAVITTPKEIGPVTPSDQTTSGTPTTTPSPPSVVVLNSTVNPVTTNAPPSPNSPTTPAANTPKSRFDGPSFVGGIVLTVGLVAMGFIGFKYYKSRTDRNYHTL